MSGEIEVLVGTIGRAHGLRGEVSVRVRTDEPARRFHPGACVVVDGRRRTLRAVRWHSGVLLVAFEGIEDRTGAEALRGHDVWARVVGDEEPAADDEFYDRQLVGLEVHDAAGGVRGRVRAVLHLPGQDVLAVDTGAGERLVPFVAALVPVVDLRAGFVQVADVRGLLEEDAE